MLRFDRNMAELFRRMDQNRLRSEQEHGVIIAELRDLREESRAQRGALLALIHEMRGNGPAPATERGRPVYFFASVTFPPLPSQMPTVKVAFAALLLLNLPLSAS